MVGCVSRCIGVHLSLLMIGVRRDWSCSAGAVGSGCIMGVSLNLFDDDTGFLAVLGCFGAVVVSLMAD